MTSKTISPPLTGEPGVPAQHDQHSQGRFYFGGQGVGTDVLKLLAWLGVGLVLLAVPIWREIGPRSGRPAPA